MTSPNETLYNLGGDGFFIYYNALFHSCYGDGLLLSGMNYPWGEYIFLTDSMASFSILFNLLNELGLPTCDYAIGVIHSTIILLMPLTAVFLYLVLRKLETHSIISFFGALLIAFMSPQLLRFLSHFGLSFPFLLPAAIYWYFRFTEHKRLDWYSFLMIALILFFGLNNPYIGFIVSAFMGLSMFFYLVMHKDISTFLKGALVSSIALIVIFIVVKFGDVVDDRIKTQWGFFFYGADIKGLFIGEYGLFRKWFGGIIDLPKIKFETQANIGVVAFFVLCISLVLRLISFYTKNNPFTARINHLLPLLFASIVLYLYAAHFFIGKWGQPFMEEYLGVLTMFKAAGRFIWPLYYVLTVMAVLIVDQLFGVQYKVRPIASIIGLVMLGGIWTMDAGQFIKNKYLKNRYKNPFQYDTEKIDEALSANNINSDEYQAIYVVPKMQGWNGKLYVDLDYISHHFGLITSFRSQLPIINAMLSRMSISQTIQSQQFASPPIVEKELLQHLDMNKKILLLKSNKSKIDVGEQYLVSRSIELHENKSFSLFSLDPQSLIESEELKKVRADYSDLKATESYSAMGEWFYHDPFDQEEKDIKKNLLQSFRNTTKGESNFGRYGNS